MQAVMTICSSDVYEVSAIVLPCCKKCVAHVDLTEIQFKYRLWIKSEIQRHRNIELPQVSTSSICRREDDGAFVYQLHGVTHFI